MGSCLHTSTAVAVKLQSEDFDEARHYRCKSWSCDHCKEINRRKVVRIARESKPRALLTLTVSSKHYAEPGEAARSLVRGLRLLRLRLGRDRELANFEFMAVFEAHKSGWPHLHLIIRGKYLPWHDLQRMWFEITGSTHIDIRKINSKGQAALYVAKYIGKDLHHFEHCKRWWRSHHFSDEMVDDYDPNNATDAQTRFGIRRQYLQMALEDCDYQVEEASSHRLRWTKPPPTAEPFEAVIRLAFFYQSMDIDWSGENSPMKGLEP